eukprot:4882184-Pyramimonas_sp.AAC.1
MFLFRGVTATARGANAIKGESPPHVLAAILKLEQILKILKIENRRLKTALVDLFHWLELPGVPGAKVPPPNHWRMAGQARNGFEIRGFDRGAKRSAPISSGSNSRPRGTRCLKVNGRSTADVLAWAATSFLSTHTSYFHLHQPTLTTPLPHHPLRLIMSAITASAPVACVAYTQAAKASRSAAPARMVGMKSAKGLPALFVKPTSAQKFAAVARSTRK